MHAVQEPCPIELKTKATCKTAESLHSKWQANGGGRRFFRLQPGDDLVRQLGIPQEHFDQTLHHAATLTVSRCLYAVGTVRSIVYVALFDFSQHDLNAYIAMLERTFWPRVRWMYEDGYVETNIPDSLQDFGFAIERYSLVQRVQLWRAFVRSAKGSDAFASRPSRIKLRPSVAMQWNYAMGNVDIAHRLMMTASLPTSSGLSSQQALAFKFFTVLVFNAYRV